MKAIDRLPVSDTGLTIGRLGYGCARLFGGKELSSSQRLVAEALELGLTHFDTAPSYAYGQSEAVLGSVLGDQPNVTIATKVGLPPTGSPSMRGTLYRQLVRPMLAKAPMLKSALLRRRERAPTVMPEPQQKRVLGQDEIEASLGRSLSLLKRSSIDLLLVHEPDQFVIDDELQSRFEGLRQAGAIRAYGLAYGGPAPSVGQFGQVLQQAFPGTEPAVGAGAVSIYHGVVRQRGNTTAAEALRRAFDIYPKSAFIVSASAPAQIRSLVSGLGNALDQQPTFVHKE